MSGFAAEFIDERGRLEALATEWWGLWNRAGDPLPFLAPAWLLPWWRHFSPGRLFTFAIRKDGVLVALAPFYIENGPLGRRILPLGISLSDHLDILVDPKAAEPALDALAAAVLSRAGDWDVWELEELPPAAAALRLRLPAGTSDSIQTRDPCPFLALPPGTAVLADILPRAKRRHLNLARNRAARDGAVTIATSDEQSALPHLEHLFRLHRLRWESRGGEGVLAPESVQAFQRDAVPGLQRAGLLRIDTLAFGGQVVAAHYELVTGDCTFIYLTGFDPARDYESPSVILLAHALERAITDGRSGVDLLRGSEAYKYEWGAVDRPNLKRSIRHDAHVS